MNDYDDLDWLAAQQPVATRLDADDARRARSALLAHVHGRRAPLAAVRPTAPVRRAPERRWIRPSRILALTAVATAAAVAALAIGGGGGDGGKVAGVGAVDQAVAAPLVRLSNAVGDDVARPGDATLVLRRNTLGSDKTWTGADLYLDDGEYYYADTLAALPRAVAAHEELGDGWIQRITAAAVAALHTDIEQARSRMADAALDPSQPVISAPPTPAEAKQMTEAEKKKAGVGIPTRTRQTPLEHENSSIWSNSMDAIVAGGTRPDVRAGALRLLATIPAVLVSQTTFAGKPALELDARVFGDDYEEHLVIDAETGMPLHFTGGYPGKAPDVTITYTVTRVTAADIAKG